ncbi:hypothetical protein [Caldimonas sp. KR1-144]|uniref:hypothetical protein n=1 Tax=Caldimonas sp. KR1-144 TaxID=3400911 RepID=UPI003BFE3F62
MSTSPVATNLQANDNLIEDRLQVMLPPIAQSVAGCFEAVQNRSGEQPVTELVTVSNQNTLMRFFPDPASGSGWNHEEVPVDSAPAQAAIQKLVSFYQGSTLYALVHYPAAQGNQVVGMQRTVANQWGPMIFDPSLADALGKMSQTDAFVDASGTCYFYGITTALSPPTFVIVAQGGSGHWVPVWMQPVQSATASYRLLPGYGGNQMTVAVIDGSAISFQGGTVTGGELVLQGTPATQQLGLGPLSAERVFALPSGAAQEPGFLLLSTDWQLYLVSGYDGPSPSGVALTGGDQQPGGVIGVAVGQAQQGLAMVFAVDDAQQRLWLLRQAAGTTQAVGFEPWVQLGNNVASLTCPWSMGAGPELLFYDLRGNVNHLCQQVQQGNWFQQAIATPAPDGQPLADSASYCTEFVTTDANGMMLPGQVVEVSADRPCVAVINSLAYHVGVDAPATVVSDMQGRVTVAVEAASLVSPALQVSAAGLGTRGGYRADLRAHQRLAGQDPSFAVNGTTMQAAGLIPASVSPSDADELAQRAQALGQAAVAMHGAALGPAGPAAAARSPIRHRAWEVDFRRSAGMCRDLGAAEAAQLQAAATGSVLSDIWGDICNFFRNVIDDLEKLAVSIADGLVYVAVTIGQEVKHFVLKTLAEVGDCIEVFLQAVAALAKDVVDAVETAVKWLRMLFDWDDVLLTKQVVRYYLSESLTNLQAGVADQVPKALIGAFDAVKNDIVGWIDQIESYIEAGTSFNQMGPQSSSDPVSQGGPPLAGIGLASAYQANGTQCNYLHSKLLANGPRATGLPTSLSAGAGFDPSTIIAAFEQAFPSQQLQQSWQKVQAYSAQIRSAGSFLEVVVLDALEAVKDLALLVISGIEAVLLALVDLLALALTAFDDVMSVSIEIPFISQLYRDISGGQDLSMLDLMSLLIALPTTLLYKLMYGGSSLTPPFTAADVQQITSQPIAWPDRLGGSPAAALREGPAGDVLSASLATAFLICGLGYTVCDIGLDAAAAQAAGATTPPVSPPPRDATFWGGIASILFAVGMQGFGVPYAAMARIDQGKGTKADSWSVGAWCAAWVPTLLDIGFAAGSPSKKVTRLQGPVGPWLSCVAGVGMLGAGIGAAVTMKGDSNYSTASQVAVLLPVWPYILQPLVLLGDESPPTAGAQVGLWLVDLVCDVGTCIAVRSAA